ncbi:MAG TPA: DUF4382 domain-containing protein [Burkholderiales bacterium]|nr:DUF4382 domain-containing protein [Burkholderiales bacterium]
MATGTVNIGMTDAAGDFLSYTVNVTSLTLTRADGMTVQTLPQTARIDFAQLVDLSEFVTAATVPMGNYVSATMLLDYTNADLEVDDGNGHPLQVAAANIVDNQGHQVSTMSMTVKLDNARMLPIAPGIPALFDLDFNLAASNTVTNVPASPVVTVNPVLVADVNPDAPKQHRIRGPLAGVDTMNSSFTLVLRPFFLRQGDHGRMTFFTDSNTTFEIDRVGYVGGAGLAALAAEPALTATVAIGTFDLPNRRFLATEVLAGSSVAFGTDDVLSGNVLSRSGNTLVVKGAELVRNPGTLIFRDTVTVTVGGSTKVMKEGSGKFCAPSITCTTNDISVGQRVTVFGTLNAGGMALDASNGLARLLVTQLNGIASSASSSVVVMNLARIDGRPIALFDFTGTGTPGNDANPASYQVNPSGLDTTGIGATTPLKARGFMQPFGEATATDDFNAVTLINTTGAPATLVVGWPALEPAPFDGFTSSSMMVNLLSAGFFHDIFRDGVDTQLALTDTPTVQTPDPAHGLFVIGVNGMVQVYTQFGAYQTALQADLGAGKKARSFVAFGGTYDDGSKTLTAGTMATVLH